MESQATQAGKEVPIGWSPTFERQRYPLRNMAVGEHFFVPLRDRNVVRLQNSLSSCIGNIQRKTQRRFTQKRYPDGIRVWRTA